LWFKNEFYIDLDKTTNAPPLLERLKCKFENENNEIITTWDTLLDTPPSSLMDSTTSPKVKITKEQRVDAHSLTCSTLGVEGHVEAPGWGLGKVTSINYHIDLHNPNNKLVSAWFEHFWCTGEPRANSNS
jgi:hypothetical protein